MITNVTSAMPNMSPHPPCTITRYKSIPEDSNLLVNIVAKLLQTKQGTEHTLPNTLEKNLTYAGMKDVIRGEVRNLFFRQNKNYFLRFRLHSARDNHERQHRGIKVQIPHRSGIPWMIKKNFTLLSYEVCTLRIENIE